MVKNPSAMQETPVWLLGQEVPLEKDRLPTPVFMGFPGGSAGKGSACNLRDVDLIPGLGRSPGEGKGYPRQYSGLENSMGCIVDGVSKSRTRLSDFRFHCHFSLTSMIGNNVIRFAFTTLIHHSVENSSQQGKERVRKGKNLYGFQIWLYIPRTREYLENN